MILSKWFHFKCLLWQFFLFHIFIRFSKVFNVSYHRINEKQKKKSFIVASSFAVCVTLGNFRHLKNHQMKKKTKNNVQKQNQKNMKNRIFINIYKCTRCWQ